MSHSLCSRVSHQWRLCRGIEPLERERLAFEQLLEAGDKLLGPGIFAVLLLPVLEHLRDTAEAVQPEPASRPAALLALERAEEGARRHEILRVAEHILGKQELPRRIGTRRRIGRDRQLS